MAYCRGEVYAYNDGYGFAIHVGGGDVDDQGTLFYHETTLTAFRDRLLKLKLGGWEVPASAFERIDREIKESEQKWQPKTKS